VTPEKKRQLENAETVVSEHKKNLYASRGRLIAIRGIPDACTCDYDEWCGPVSEICNNYEPFSDRDESCKNCEHGRGCHE